VLRFHPLEVREIRPEAEDAVRLTLDVPLQLHDEFRARAGQHIVVRATVDGVELRRTYSLVSPAGELPLSIAVRACPGGRLSQQLASHTRAGDLLEIMPPNGRFGALPAPSTGGTYVAFAAGCGITPVFSILSSVLREDRAGRALLFYGNRTAARAMLLEDLLVLKDRHLGRLALNFVMSREPQEIELLNGRIDAGKVSAFAHRLFDPHAVTAYFVCGPGTMIVEVSRALEGLGVESSRIRTEHFTAVHGATEPGAQAVQARHGPADAGMGEELTRVSVVLDGRRRSFSMRPRGETVLEAAERSGLDLPFSCRAGVCSTCRTKVVRGEVEMEQNYALTDEELAQGVVLACQARAITHELELTYDEN
jgi:ring-1,2-phenylacetyl-CoA epoxidase subunit PaaE